MDSFITRIKTNLNGVLQMTQIIDGIMMTGDDRANQIIVELHRDREVYEIPTGTKIVGYFMRSDGVTLEIEGSIVETNQAMVVVPALAYQVPGVLSIAIRMFVDPSQEQQRGYYSSETNEFILVSDPNVNRGPNNEPVVTRTATVYANKVVIAAASCFVQITETDTIIEPGHLIPDIQDVIAKLAELDTLQQQVTEAEQIWNNHELDRDQAETRRAEHETDRETAEEERERHERSRVSAEEDRIRDEANRVSAEEDRIAAEVGRLRAEETRVENEVDRGQAESDREQAESDRATAEESRASAETARRQAENVRDTNEGNRTSAESLRASAEATRVSNEATRVSHENTRITNENNRNAAIQNMTVGADQLNYDQAPKAAISTVGGHKHIQFGLPVGRPFQIKKTFASVSAMTSYTGTDIEAYDMVMITSDVEDPNNARLYMRNSTNSGWTYITDLSGAQGIQGPSGPQGVGIASTSLVNYQLKVTYTDGSTQTLSPSIRGPQGPRGEKGEKGDPGAGGSTLQYDSEQDKLTILFG